MTVAALPGTSTHGRRLTPDALMLVGLTAAFLVIGALMAWYTQTYNAPDERMHVDYVRTLAARRLPVLTADKVTMEAHQPPLYYLALLPAYMLTQPWSERANVLALRFLSLAIGLLAVFATYLLARSLFPDQPFIRRAAAALMALNPQFIFISSVVNNDTLANTLSAVCSLLTVRVLAASRLSPRLASAAAVAVAALLATKVTAWPFALALGGAMLVRGWRTDRRRVLLASIPTLAFVAWWLGRNIAVYGTATMVPYFRTLWYDQQHRDFLSFRGVWHWATTVFDSYWARFGYFTIALRRWFYLTVRIGSLVALVGLVRFSVTSFRTLPSPRRRAIMVLVGAAVMTVIGIFVWSLNFYQPQGRFLFTSAPIFSVLISLGLNVLLPPRWKAPALAVLLLFFVTADAQALRLIARLG